MILLVIILALILMILGAPIFIVISGLALYLLSSGQIDSSAMIIEMHRMATTPILVAIPLFAFAGYLLSESGNSSEAHPAFGCHSRLVAGRVVDHRTDRLCCLHGPDRGHRTHHHRSRRHPSPCNVEGRYPETFSLGLLTTSGTLGLLFPPSLPLIIYAIVAKVGIDQLFLAGLLPGLLLMLLLTPFCIQKAMTAQVPRTQFNVSEVFSALKGGLWELPLPWSCWRNLQWVLCGE